MNKIPKIRKKITLAITGGIFWSCCAISAECPIIDLGTGVGISSYPSAINDRGRVVGTSFDATGKKRNGFLWKRGMMIDLGAFEPSAMNDKNQIIGIVPSAVNDGYPTDYHPFLWNNGVLTEIGPLGRSADIYLVGINNKGQILLSVYDDLADIYRGAAIWEKGVITRLKGLNNKVFEIQPYAINSRGQIVGFNYGDGQNGFLWQKGMLTDLGGLGGLGAGLEIPSNDIAINNIGQVAGTFYNTAGTERHAFIWKNGVKTDLGTLGGLDVSNPEQPLYGSSAVAINDKGYVIGDSITPSGERHAFLWKNGVMTDLGTLGGKSSTVTAINYRGQVIGNSTDTKGESHEFLWYKGVMKELKPLPGAAYSHVRAINNYGQIIGESVYPNQGYVSHATLWNTYCH